MAFRAIGDLAVTVLANAKLQAAAHEAPRKGGGLPKGLDDNPPIAAAVGGDPVRECGNKKGEARSPASGSSGRYGREGENAPDSSLDLGGRLKLVSVSCEPGQSRPIGRAFAPRRPGSHLTLVIDHFPPAMLQRSGSARANRPNAKTMIQSF